MSTRCAPTRSIHSLTSAGLERLDPDEVDEVFDEEEDRAEEVFEAIDDEDIENPELLDELLATVDVLVAADRRLAEVAIQDAQAASGDEDDIEDALDELEETIEALDD